MRISLFSGPVALGVALLLAACGGGGSSPGGGSATLKGQVVLRDGTTQNLGGILIRDAASGATDVTSSDGTFDLGRLSLGTLSLQVIDPLAGALAAAAPGTDDPVQPTGEEEGEDDESRDEPSTDDESTDADDESDDGDDDSREDEDSRDDESGDDGDDDDTGDDDFDLSDVDDGDEVEIEVEIRDGKIEVLRCSQSGADRRRAEAQLERAETSDDDDVSGKVRIESRADREKFSAEAEDLGGGRLVELFVMDGATEESQGVQPADEDGEAEWELSTQDGDRLPFGVSTVAELEGLRVEVRDAATGLVLLVGEIPSLPAALPGDDRDDDSRDDESEDGDEARGRARLVRVTAASGEAYVELRTEDDGEQRVKVEVEGLLSPPTVELWLEDPAGGGLTKIGTLVADDDGELELDLDTDDGDALPFGVADVSELVGLAVELRSAADGSVLYAGTTPTLLAH
jgi:hypothetical protein